MANDAGSLDLQALAEKSYNDAVEYVNKLPSDCMYSDGYYCAEVSDKNKLGVSGDYASLMDASGTLPAPVLQAWPVAYQAFQQQDILTEKQKQLKHYRVGFKHDNGEVTVLFRPLLLPQLVDGDVVGKMRAAFGKEVRVSVSADDFSIIKVIFGR